MTAPSRLYCTGEGLSAQSRAQQLAAVAVAVYEAAGSGIHLPLEASNPLLTILKQALDKDDSQGSVGQSLANALLESVLQAVDTEADSFPPLIVGFHTTIVDSFPLLIVNPIT